MQLCSTHGTQYETCMFVWHSYLRVGPTLTVQYALEGLLAHATLSTPPKQASNVVGTAYLIDRFLCLGRFLPAKTPMYRVPCNHSGILVSM